MLNSPLSRWNHCWRAWVCWSRVQLWDICCRKERNSSSSHPLKDDVFSACLSENHAIPEARKQRTGAVETWHLCIALPPWVATSSDNIPWIQCVTGTWMSSPSQLCALIFKGKFCPFSSDEACAMAEDLPLLCVHSGASSVAFGVSNREQEYKLWDCHLKKPNFA